MRNKFCISKAVIAIIAFFTCIEISAQPDSPNDSLTVFKGMNWRNAKPTDGAYKVYKELSADLAKQLADLNKLLENKSIQPYQKPIAK